jgi:hypothetical protein
MKKLFIILLLVFIGGCTTTVDFKDVNKIADIVGITYLDITYFPFSGWKVSVWANTPCGEVSFTKRSSTLRGAIDKAVVEIECHQSCIGKGK